MLNPESNMVEDSPRHSFSCFNFKSSRCDVTPFELHTTDDGAAMHLSVTHENAEVQSNRPLLQSGQDVVPVLTAQALSRAARG